MRWMTFLVVGLLALGAPQGLAQEIVITDFPLGVGGDIETAFFEPYYPQLQAVADTLAAYPLARAVIVGSADGYRYDDDNDAKNPGLSLGRAHALRNVLVEGFQVDSAQIVIQSKDVPYQGGEYRSVSVRIDRSLMGQVSQPPAVVAEPRVDTQIIEVHQVTTEKGEVGLRLSAGVSSSPYGAIPLVAAAITWRHIVFLEAVAGHQFWTESYDYEGTAVATWSRMFGLDIQYCPWEKVPLGFVGGWYRIEELAKDYQEYARLSEGPAIGVTATPIKWASITGLWMPSRNRDADETNSTAENGRFLLQATVHLDLGGAR